MNPCGGDVRGAYVTAQYSIFSMLWLSVAGNQAGCLLLGRVQLQVNIPMLSEVRRRVAAEG